MYDYLLTIAQIYDTRELRK